MTFFRASLAMIIGICGSSSAMFAQETDSASQTKNPHAYATAPEGKTLPQNVVRTRLGYGVTTSDGNSYDKNGNKGSSPVSVKAAGGSVILEYGYSNKLSLQVRQDFRTAYEIRADKSSSAFREIRDAKLASAEGQASVNQIAGLIASTTAGRAAFCGNAAMSVGDCVGLILTGSARNATGADQPIQNSQTGETLFVVPNSASLISGINGYVGGKIEDQIDTAVKTDGGKGIGDTTVGFLYAVIQEPGYEVSIGAGARYPTGNRDRGINEAKVGRGLSEVGLRLNLDLLPIESLRISWENQSEAMLAAGKYKSMGEDVTVKRNGVRNVGFLILKPSLAGISESLAFIGPSFGVAYDYDSEEVLKSGSKEEVSSGPRSGEVSWKAGLGFNLFDFGLPLQLETDYTKSFRGNNVSVATDTFVTQLKGFYAF